jgi:predicted metalloprotease
VRDERGRGGLAGAFPGGRIATETGLLKPITKTQIDDALNAAAAVGDDRIQSQAQGTIDKEVWTHGSSRQRQTWFTTGYENGDVTKCDTFGGSI